MFLIVTVIRGFTISFDGRATDGTDSQTPGHSYTRYTSALRRALKIVVTL